MSKAGHDFDATVRRARDLGGRVYAMLLLEGRPVLEVLIALRFVRNFIVEASAFPADTAADVDGLVDRAPLPPLLPPRKREA